MKQMDWYFDFISPFAYLQSEMLEQLQGVETIRYRPLLFAGLLNHWENKGPAEIPPKRQWTFEHCAWLAHHHGIPMCMPPEHPFNPLPLLRLCLALDCTPEVVQRLFRFVWREGHIPSESEHWQALLDELYVSRDMLDTPEVKNALRKNGEDAIAARVFGVPTAVVDGRCFWGLDGTSMLQAYLNGDAFFDSDALRAAQQMPNGQQRKVPERSA
ncbi:MAG: DsbA family protein [Burkholderiales bacterium]|nr:DsbA family protein [Burkholderiales bacterium]